MKASADKAVEQRSEDERPATYEELSKLIDSSDEWAVGALVHLYQFQTPDEQKAHRTDHLNECGFNAFDAGVLSDIAEFYEDKGFLTSRQLAFVKKALKKYINQLLRVEVQPLPLKSFVPTQQKETHMSASLLTKDDKPSGIQVGFNFPKGDSRFGDILTKVKTLPDRRWMAEEKYWRVGLSLEAGKKLKEWGFEFSSGLQKWLDDLTKPVDEKALNLNGLDSRLFPFQRTGVAFVESRKGRALIADEMGLGKTAQAISWLRLHPELRPVVVVCPASLKLLWQREFEMWGRKDEKTQIISGLTNGDNSIWGDIIILNYDLLSDWFQDFVEPQKAQDLIQRAAILWNQDFEVIGNEIQTSEEKEFNGMKNVIADFRNFRRNGESEDLSNEEIENGLSILHRFLINISRLKNLDLLKGEIAKLKYWQEWINEEYKKVQEKKEIPGWASVLVNHGIKAIIFDEVHYMKSRRAQRTKAAKRLAKKASHVIALSGTPIVNRPIEFFNSINMIRPDIFPSFWRYAQEFCGAKWNGFGWDFTGATNTDKLHKLLTETIMIRRRKEDVLKDLPAKIYAVVPFEIDNRREYKRASENIIAWILQNEGREKADRASRAEVLVEFEKLKQLAVQGKMEAIKEWVTDFLESGEKLVLFATHTATLDILQAEFKDLAVRLDGSTSQGDRQKAVDRFQNDDKVRLFLGNVKAAGVGITLTAASNVGFVELPWTPGDYEQAADRLHRIGQKNAVNVWTLVAQNTVEEDIAVILSEKQKVLAAVLDGKQVDEETVLSLLIQKTKKKGGKLWIQSVETC